MSRAATHSLECDIFDLLAAGKVLTRNREKTNRVLREHGFILLQNKNKKINFLLYPPVASPQQVA